MEFRLANESHAEGISALIALTWGNAADEQWIGTLLRQSLNTVWVALDHGDMLGFCAGFATTDPLGMLRWEVDLLAVHPNARSRGIGRELVARSSQSGYERACTFQRALIAVDNLASERCFAANGFTEKQKCELWVADPSAAAPAQSTAAAHLVRVETLTYRGLWIEGSADAPTLIAARGRAHAEGRSVVGIVIPAGIEHEAHRLGFTCIAVYQWWVLHR